MKGDSSSGSSSDTSERYFKLKPRRSSRRTSSANPKPGSRSLDSIVGSLTGGPRGRRLGETGHKPAHYRQFVHLVSRMLDYDPAARIKPAEALRASFFTDPDAGEGKSATGERRREVTVDSGPKKIISDAKATVAAPGGDRWASPSQKKQQPPAAAEAATDDSGGPQDETMNTSSATRPGSAPAAAESRDAATQTPERKG